ncbi:MAG: type II toxin-antitoxin system RelE/ParE family toxin [Ardenticatenaceae bacterium]|nr:type II toxin-antitoxin system RelE/ParE family toxin [Ardenticatenaceae bacterium]
MPPVVFTSQAEENLAKLDKQIAQRILKKIRWLVENVGTITPEPLTGQFQGVYKLRVGDYRVLYTLEDEQNLIVIRLIKHRREVYK